MHSIHPAGGRSSQEPSDKTTLTEHANLPNSLPNLGLIAIGLANVEGLQAPVPQQMCNRSSRDTSLREDEADRLASMLRSLREKGIY